VLSERPAIAFSSYLGTTSPVSAFLLTVLSILAWLSTFTGMMELINANWGEVGVGYMTAIGVVVATLQLMVLYILTELFSGRLNWWLYPLYFGFYLILLAISIGFSFSFYWKYIVAREAARESAELAIAEVQNTLAAGLIGLTQLSETFTDLASRSAEMAGVEHSRGQTCPGSRPGDGPRRRLREKDEQRFSWARRQVQRQIEGVNQAAAGLQATLAALRSDGSGGVAALGSRATLRDLNARLEGVAMNFRELRRDPQLHAIRDELERRAGQTEFTDGGLRFNCPDEQLETALKGVIQAIDAAPEIQAPRIDDSVEAGAVREAFNRLGVSALLLLNKAGVATQRADAGHKPPPGAEKRRELKGLGERDYAPLILSVFVDLGVALVAFNRPRPTVPQETIERLRQRLARACAQSGLTKTSPLAPVEAVVFRRLGRLYGVVPLDFRAGAADLADRPGRQAPKEPSYLHQAFEAISVEGLARPAGWLDRMAAGLTWAVVGEELRRQTGARYAQARAFRLYLLGREWPEASLRLAETGPGAGPAPERRRPAAPSRHPDSRTASPGDHAPLDLDS
jgi:hypothetical protein